MSNRCTTVEELNTLQLPDIPSFGHCTKCGKLMGISSLKLREHGFLSNSGKPHYFLDVRQECPNGKGHSRDSRFLVISDDYTYWKWASIYDEDR